MTPQEAYRQLRLNNVPVAIAYAASEDLAAGMTAVNSPNVAAAMRWIDDAEPDE